jgi:hypothetical protein
MRLQSSYNILSDERMDLLYTIATGPRQCSHSQVRVPRDSWPHFTLSDSRLPQPGGPGPRIDIPHEQSGPVIPQVRGSIFVASYDSQGYSGGIRPHLHTGPDWVAPTVFLITSFYGPNRKHSFQE